MKNILFVLGLASLCAGNLLAQRRTEIMKLPVESKDGNFNIFSEGNNFIIHTTTQDRQGAVSQALMLINMAENTQKTASINTIEKKNPYLFSPTFTRKGFGFFEAVDNNKDNKIDLYLHELVFAEMSVSSKVIHSVAGKKKDEFLFFHNNQNAQRKSTLYILNKGSDKQNALATVISFDLEYKETLKQEINFSGTIVPEFNGFVTLSKTGNIVSMHQIKDKKLGIFVEVSILNTNSRTEPVTKFPVTQNENESLSSHKIYVDDLDIIHIYGTLHKKGKENEASLFYRVYGITRKKEIVSYYNPVPLTNNIKAHTLLTVSPEYTVYVVEQGNFDSENGGMRMLAQNSSKPSYVIDPSDDEQTRKRKEEEIRRLKEQGLFDNGQENQTKPRANKSENIIHIYCIGSKGTVLWSDAIRRNFSLTNQEFERMDDANFGFYIWAVDDRLILFFNDMEKTNNGTSLGAQNASQQGSPIKTITREYSLKTSKFSERKYEPTEKLNFTFSLLPGLTSISQSQLILTMTKNDKGKYYPCKVIF